MTGKRYLPLLFAMLPAGAGALPITQDYAGEDWTLTVTYDTAPPGIGSIYVYDFSFMWRSYGPFGGTGSTWFVADSGEVERLADTLQMVLTDQVGGSDVWGFASPEPLPVPEPTGALALAAGLLAILCQGRYAKAGEP